MREPTSTPPPLRNGPGGPSGTPGQLTVGPSTSASKGPSPHLVRRGKSLSHVSIGIVINHFHCLTLCIKLTLCYFTCTGPCYWICTYVSGSVLVFVLFHLSSPMSTALCIFSMCIQMRLHGLDLCFQVRKNKPLHHLKWLPTPLPLQLCL